MKKRSEVYCIPRIAFFAGVAGIAVRDEFMVTLFVRDDSTWAKR